MHFYRISKYNPEFRDQQGRYMKQEEWTSISDIGKLKDSNGNILTIEEYLKVENAYIQTCKKFFELNSVESLKIVNVNFHEVVKDSDSPQDVELQNFLNSFAEKQEVNSSEIKSAIQTVLRELGDFQLQSETLAIAAGYDYYLYIASELEFDENKLNIDGVDIYIERQDKFIVDLTNSN